MNICETALPGLLVIEPKVFADERGWFMETFHGPRFAAAGMSALYVQDNQSQSRRGVLRGMHYQIQHPQGKLVRATRGSIFDVAVDLRVGSATFGRWVGIELSEENRKSVYIPPGFAHGFLALSEVAEITYKCTDVYHPEHERTLLWNDPTIGIEWPLAGEPILSEKDRRGLPLTDADCFAEPPQPSKPHAPAIAPPHFPINATISNTPAFQADEILWQWPSKNINDSRPL